MCGFCTPGFVMAATALLERNPHPTAEEAMAGLSGNICRCGTYTRVLEAVLDTKGVSRG
jgi:aerobic-type carbon monoxide dehydrogenase small subunit (CoxS/CutS family)